MANREHVAQWAHLFDSQMDEALANAKNIDVDGLLKIIESTISIHAGITKRSNELIESIKNERAANEQKRL